MQGKARANDVILWTPYGCLPAPVRVIEAVADAGLSRKPACLSFDDINKTMKADQ